VSRTYDSDPFLFGGHHWRLSFGRNSNAANSFSLMISLLPHILMRARGDTAGEGHRVGTPGDSVIDSVPHSPINQALSTEVIKVHCEFKLYPYAPLKPPYMKRASANYCFINRNISSEHYQTSTNSFNNSGAAVLSPRMDVDGESRDVATTVYRGFTHFISWTELMNYITGDCKLKVGAVLSSAVFDSDLGFLLLGIPGLEDD